MPADNSTPEFPGASEDQMDNEPQSSKPVRLKRDGTPAKVGIKSTNQELERRIDLIASYLMKNPIASDFELHEQFCQEFDVTWVQINRYANRARAQIRKRINMPRDDALELLKKTLMGLLASKSEAIQAKASDSWSRLFGFNAPLQIAPVNPDGTPLFVPLRVNPKEITG